MFEHRPPKNLEIRAPVRSPGARFVLPILPLLGDVDRHVKHMAKLDFVFAILSLGGLGVAVSDCVCLQWMMCLRCNA